MGLCHDFGAQISEGCDHPMRAGSGSCRCDQCGIVCNGRFDACPEVWARGPHPAALASPPARRPPAVPAPLAPAPAAPAATAPAHQVPAGGREGANGRLPSPPNAGNGHGPAAPDDSRAEVLRWFQSAFGELRQEVQALRQALCEEQDRVAALVESRDGSLGTDPEALRALVSGAIRKAMSRQAAELEASVAASVVASVAGLRRDLEASVASSVDGLRRDLEAMKVSQERQSVALQQAIQTASGDWPSELSRHDAANRKAFQATLDRRLKPLVEVVTKSAVQSDRELEAVETKLEGLSHSGASVSAALAEVTASLAALAGGRRITPAADDDNRVDRRPGLRVSLRQPPPPA
ncbi:MAG: hypothetical protein QOD63_2041 [Actinomycetota bacterium]|jgi:hypothetical protein|nr:hypothetical protein [Actinomycetota bacterium]